MQVHSCISAPAVFCKEKTHAFWGTGREGWKSGANQTRQWPSLGCWQARGVSAQLHAVYSRARCRTSVCPALLNLRPYYVIIINFLILLPFIRWSDGTGSAMATVSLPPPWANSWQSLSAGKSSCPHEHVRRRSWHAAIKTLQNETSLIATLTDQKKNNLLLSPPLWDGQMQNLI